MLEQPRKITAERLLTVVALVVLLHALFAWSRGIHHVSLSDQFGFRQTQTAISVRSMLNGGPWLLYDTPILGPPWSLPLEFPLYHWITALVVLGGVRLQEAGRAVSIAFFLAALIGTWKTLSLLAVERVAKLSVSILLLTCPIYLFWTRTFLIETCALALAVWYVYFGIEAAKQRRAKHFAICLVLGALAAMVKITTFIPMLVLLVLYFAVQALQQKSSLHSRIFWLMSAIVLPLAAGVVWTELANQVQVQNPLAASFLSSKEMTPWVFGDLTDRFSKPLWNSVYKRILPDIIGWRFTLPLLAASAFFFPRRYRLYAFISAWLFLLPILIFPRLQMFHSYYQSENALFLSVACGLLLCDLIRQSGWLRCTGCALILMMVGGSLARYYHVYYQSARGPAMVKPLQGMLAQRLTLANQVIIVRGDDWSSELPFYSERNAIMDRDFPLDLLQRELKALPPLQVGAVVLCDGSREESDGDTLNERLQKLQQRYGVHMATLRDDGSCLYYSLRKTDAPPGPLPFLATLDEPQDHAEVSASVLVRGWALSAPPVQEILVEVDGVRASSGHMGWLRPDLVTPFEKYSGHPLNGFHIVVNTSQLAAGKHSLRVHASLQDGSDHPIKEVELVKR